MIHCIDQNWFEQKPNSLTSINKIAKIFIETINVCKKNLATTNEKANYFVEIPQESDYKFLMYLNKWQLKVLITFLNSN